MRRGNEEGNTGMKTGERKTEEPKKGLERRKKKRRGGERKRRGM